MRRSTLSLLPFLAALALAPLSGCSERVEAKGVLRFTAIPNENTTELAERFAPLARHLSEVLGVPVEYVPTIDYTASVQAFTNGDVQLAWFGGLTGVEARRKVPGSRAIAMGKVDAAYKSYFVASSESGLEPSEEFPLAMAGHTFTFGSRRSTSGRMMPEYYIRKYTGKSPAEFFGSEPGFSGSHDKTAKLVEAGTYDAGALDYKTYDRMVAEGKLDPTRCRIIWTTPPYADYNFTAHPSLEESFGKGFIERLQEALVSLDDPALLDAVNRPEGLVPASNEDFAALESLALELGLVR